MLVDWQTLFKKTLIFIFIISVFGYCQDWGKAFEQSSPSNQKSFKVLNVPWFEQQGLNTDSFYWIKLAALVVAICFAFNSIVFMLGYVLNADNIKRFAISEFYQTTATAFLIVFMFVLLNFGFVLIQNLFFPKGQETSFFCQDQEISLWDSSSGPFRIIKCKISQYLQAAYTIFLNSYNQNMVAEVEASECYSLTFLGMVCKDWDPFIHKNVEALHYIANRAASLSISLVAQYFFVDYLEKNLLSFFLPVGLLLRLFPPSRQIGNLFISVTIGFYFVFPLVFLLIQPDLAFDMEASKPSKNSIIKSACYSKFGAFFSTSNKVTSTFFAFSSDINQFLYQITLGTFFYPFVALIITVMSISFLASFLGSDVSILVHFISKNL
jgi:hypothetical protein